jgi:hypothetical protein
VIALGLLAVLVLIGVGSVVLDLELALRSWAAGRPR